MLQNAMRYFGAGAAGGLMNSVALWAFGTLGITAALGVSIAPHWSPHWLYPRIVWGGIWGVLLFLPVLNSRPFARAFVLSLGPTVVQCFVVFPFKAHKGIGGVELGLLTPLFVVFFNYVWGLTAVLLAQAGGRR